MVSIIIPHYNRAKLLAETIESVRTQSYEHWEIIVVDDGSDDREWQAIKLLADLRIKIIRRTDGLKGPSRCRNLGVAASRGDYLLFLDSDDLLAPWCLSRRLRGVEESPGLDLWIFPVMLFDTTPGDLSLCWNRLDGGVDLERFLRSDPPWHTSSPLWRREAFDRVVGFNEAILYGDDADLHIRAMLHGLNYMKFPRLLPDIFIRRSEMARITNSPNLALLQSRWVRLTEGSKILRSAGAGAQIQQIWEGQYFVEGEFLLFNVQQPKVSINRVIESWKNTCHPPMFRKLIAQGYFEVAQYFQTRAYLILRLARRISMLILPPDFFPKGGDFQSYIIDPGSYSELHNRLIDHESHKK